MSKDGQISSRSKQVLKVLVEQYIQDGQPIGSKVLVRESGLDISSSTVRNIMSELEGRGLVHSPHTSAGRVPTSQGYRLFVDSLLTVKSVQGQDIHQLANQLVPGVPLKDVAESVSSMLSSLTNMAGLVMLPGNVPQMLRHIEFLPLSGRQVLVILVVNDRDVQNMIIDVPRDYSEAELTQSANYLNSIFSGQSLHEVRTRLLAELRSTQTQMDAMMQAAIAMAGQVFEQGSRADEQDCVITGQTNLMGFDELSDVETLRGLFDAFNEKREILSLLDHSVNGQGVKIFIGEESGSTLFNDCSLVTSTYELDGEVVGVLGVVGPTRMAYDQVIPIVDMTARLVSAALNPKDKPL